MSPTQIKSKWIDTLCESLKFTLQAGPRGEREIQFYRTITEATDPSLTQFQQFIPNFYGSCTKKDGQFMMIENATMRMTRPCIMDIKVKPTLDHHWPLR